MESCPLDNLGTKSTTLNKKAEEEPALHVYQMKSSIL